MTFVVTTTVSAGTVISSDGAAEYRCKHCNDWQEDHVDGVHCLFAPTDYTVPTYGERGEYRVTGKVIEVPLLLPMGTTSVNVGDAVTVWGMNYAVITL